MAAENLERKAEKEGEAGHTKATAEDEKKASAKEAVAEKEEKSAKKEEVLAEQDEHESQKELSKAQKDERLAENYEKGVEKTEQNAERDGVDDASLQDTMKGEMTELKEELQTRSKISITEDVGHKESKAQNVERQSEKEEMKSEKEEKKAERADVSSHYKKGETNEANAENDEHRSDRDEATAEKVETQAEAKLVGRQKKANSDDAVTKLYDLKTPAIAHDSSLVTMSFVVCVAFAALAVVGVYKMKQNSRRDPYFMPVGGDDIDDYDSEAPLE